MKYRVVHNLASEKKRSTVDAIFILNAVISKIINEKGRLYCAFIDLKMAFDNIYRNALWFKMHRLGINAKLLRIVRNMYANIKSCIKVATHSQNISNVLLA